MAKKKTARRAKSPAAGKRGKSDIQEIANSAAAAIAEISLAVESIRSSLEHVQKARQKAGPAVTRIERAAKGAGKAVSNTVAQGRKQIKSRLASSRKSRR